MEEFSVKRTNHFKILTVLAIAASLSLGAYMYSAKEVTISIDDETKEVISYSDTVEDFLKTENITLDKDSYINVPLNTKLENNIHIIIKTPKSYTVSIGDKQNEVKSVHVKVSDILKDLDIELGEKDYTHPKLNEKVSFGGEIEIFKVREVVEEVDQAIPYENVVNNSNKLDIGVVKVVQKGKEGLKKIQIKKVFENGKLVSEDVIAEEVVEKPISKIVEKGTRKKVVTTSRGGARYKHTVTMTATAYDLSYKSCGKKPGDKYYGLTASGTRARKGAVAVDPRVIPLGTKLYVESLDGTKDYGFCVAEDTGGAIKNNKIDLFFDSASEVKNFGRRKVKVYILE